MIKVADGQQQGIALQPNKTGGIKWPNGIVALLVMTGFSMGCDAKLQAECFIMTIGENISEADTDEGVTGSCFCEVQRHQSQNGVCLCVCDHFTGQRDVCTFLTLMSFLPVLDMNLMSAILFDQLTVFKGRGRKDKMPSRTL